jgi:hypothetical protein
VLQCSAVRLDLFQKEFPVRLHGVQGMFQLVDSGVVFLNQVQGLAIVFGELLQLGLQSEFDRFGHGLVPVTGVPHSIGALGASVIPDSKPAKVATISHGLIRRRSHANAFVAGVATEVADAPNPGHMVRGILRRGKASPGRGLRPARTAAAPGKEAKRSSLHRDRQDHQD